jgi:hypothetical protein
MSQRRALGELTVGLISGILEPCYDVGGDAFDYAVNGDTAHLALFDAVGHGSGGGMRAVILASLAPWPRIAMPAGAGSTWSRRTTTSTARCVTTTGAG